jgi:hypothetical protein
MMYETFFAEEPRATNWIQRDISGLPILLTYGYQQSFRYQPCFSHQEYIDYLKTVVRYAVVDVKTDFIHFDNFGLNPEPDSCHCSSCVHGFRNYLRMKYSPALLRERFGFDNISFVNPPQWNSDNQPAAIEIIYDPAIQEWIDFRCQLMANALEQVSHYAKSLNPHVAIEINPGGINGENHPWTVGVDHARLLKFTEAYCSEERDDPAYLQDGRLVSKIRSYKLARTYNNVLITYTPDNPVAMAEALAFNQTLGDVGSNPLPANTLRYISFYRKYREMYQYSEDVAPIAVFRSYASLTYHNARTQLSSILVEQALIQSRIPFALIFDEHLHDLSSYSALVLPNSECLSDEQISLIRNYVSQGGGLVVTEQAGLYDNWRRTRVTPGLDGLVKGQTAGVDYQENVTSNADTSGQPSRNQVGLGRVVYLPSVQFDGVFPQPEPYGWISNVFWKRPGNWKEIVESVQWAARDLLPFVVDGPDFLVASLTRQPKKRRLLIHLVNYDSARNPTLTDLHIRVVMSNDKVVRTVIIHDVEANEAYPLEFTNDISGTRFTLTRMSAYALIALQW